MRTALIDIQRQGYFTLKQGRSAARSPSWTGINPKRRRRLRGLFKPLNFKLLTSASLRHGLSLTDP